jgi:cyclopropane-fatty-acyl-phospholipid synthase
LALLGNYLKARIKNHQSKSRAHIVAVEHYDTGNDLFEKMLGTTMAYTCAYWKNANDLDQAQKNKLDLVCKKMKLKPGMKVLDIGCGFGSFMKYAAENYGVSCVGITLSKEQIEFGEEFCKGLPVEFRYMDYRDIDEKFDRVISIGMFEAVGYKNFRVFMESVDKCLKDEGMFLLHTIGGISSQVNGDPWTEKYIFPNGMLPSIAQIGKSIENIFVMEDWHNFGQYYDLTLMAWFQNFDKSWPDLKEKYGDRFYRMWKYYLLSFAGYFRAREGQLWQIVMTKKGLEGGYESVR